MTTPRIITDDRFTATIAAVTYIASIGLGAFALRTPPYSILGAVGPSLTTFWASCALMCGVVGAWGLLVGSWWAERVALRAGLTGVLMYAAIAYYLHHVGPGNRMPQVFALVIASAAFAFRYRDVRGLNYAPGTRCQGRRRRRRRRRD